MSFEVSTFGGSLFSGKGMATSGICKHSLFSRAREAVFKVRGPVTTYFEVGGWGGGEEQIWLFSLCGCLEL